MSGYGDVKSKKVRKVLQWLQRNSDVEVTSGGKHPTKVKCIHTGSVYPLPLGHKVINKYVLRGFVDWLIINEVCTENDFKTRL